MQIHEYMIDTDQFRSGISKLMIKHHAIDVDEKTKTYKIQESLDPYKDTFSWLKSFGKEQEGKQLFSYKYKGLAFYLVERNDDKARKIVRDYYDEEIKAVSEKLDELKKLKNSADNSMQEM